MNAGASFNVALLPGKAIIFFKKRLTTKKESATIIPLFLQQNR
jgi:hypothetical protein